MLYIQLQPYCFLGVLTDDFIACFHDCWKFVERTRVFRTVFASDIQDIRFGLILNSQCLIGNQFEYLYSGGETGLRVSQQSL